MNAIKSINGYCQKYIFIKAILLMVFMPLHSWGNDEIIYVDNICGSDKNNGTKNTPLASIERACALVKKSGRIVVKSTGKPYSLPYDGPDKPRGLRLYPGGTLERPLIVEGNGAVISGLAKIPASEWKKETEKIYSLHFFPMSNCYKNYMNENYWLDGTKIWFVDGREAPNCHSREELEKTPGGFWWNKVERRVLFHLPARASIETCTVELPANYGFYIQGDHTIVKDFVVIGSWNDGFDTAGTLQHAVYKNCVAIGNCGQGFSAHGTGSVYYEDCVSFRCASSAVCNIDQSRAVYKRCVLAENTFEAAVFLNHDADALFEQCLIVDPEPYELIWQSERSSLAFADSILIGNGKSNLIRLKAGTVALLNCTLLNGSGIVAGDNAESTGSVSLKHCAVKNFSRYYIRLPQGDFTPKQFALEDNLYSPAVKHFHAGTQLSPDTVEKNTTIADFLLQGKRRAELVNASMHRSKRQGAIIPDSVWLSYEKWRRARISPAGITFANTGAENE